MTRYESVMDYLSIRNVRTLTRLERERAGTTIPIVAAGESIFVTTSPEIEQLVGQWRLLLTEDSEDGEMAQMRFADYRWRNKWFVPEERGAGLRRDLRGDRGRGRPPPFHPENQALAPSLPTSCRGGVICCTQRSRTSTPTE